MSSYSNMVMIPKELFTRLIAAIETPLDLSENSLFELIEDAQEWIPNQETSFISFGITEAGIIRDGKLYKLWENTDDDS